MTVRQFTFNPFQTNTFVCHSGDEAAIIDASSSTPDEHAEIERYLDTHGLAVRHLLLTHAHIDHIFGCSRLSQTYEAGFKLHRQDLPLLDHSQEQAAMFGVELDKPPRPAGYLEEGDVVSIGDARMEVLHTPGHSPGSVCFFDAESRILIGGDVLFAGSIGRTDLWQGSLPVLMQSIYTKLLPLGDDVTVYPGHGPETNLGTERKTNPFLTDGFSTIE